MFGFNKIKTENLIPAIMLSFAYICGAINIDGISVMLIFVLWIICLSKTIMKQYKTRGVFLMISLFVLVMFLFSFILLQKTDNTFYYFERFIFYNVLALFVGTQDFDKRKVLNLTMIIGMVFMPIYTLRDYTYMENGYKMGASYAILPIIIIALIELIYSDMRRIRILAATEVLGLSYKSFIIANRGVWIVIITFLFFVLYRFICKKGIKIYREIKGMLYILISALSIYAVAANFISIVTILYDYIKRKYSIDVYALWKILFYFKKGDITNGRQYIYSLAVRFARKNLLMGHGIGAFESAYDLAHCHNLFLQGLCEGGIVIAIIFFVYTAWVLKNIFFQPIRDTKVTVEWLWIVITFLLGVEVLLISSVYWLYPMFWFFLGNTLSDIVKKRKMLLVRYAFY